MQRRSGANYMAEKTNIYSVKAERVAPRVCNAFATRLVVPCVSLCMQRQCGALNAWTKH